MPLIGYLRRKVKKHNEGLSDYLKKCQFTIYKVHFPNRSVNRCTATNYPKRLIMYLAFCFFADSSNFHPNFAGNTYLVFNKGRS